MAAGLAIVPATLYFFVDRDFRAIERPEIIDFEDLTINIGHKTPYIQLSEGCVAENHAYEQKDNQRTTYFLVYPCTDTLTGILSKAIIAKKTGSRTELRNRNNEVLSAGNLFSGRISYFYPSDVSEDVLELLDFYPNEQPTYILDVGETPESAERGISVIASVTAIILAILTGIFFLTSRKKYKESKHFTAMLEQRIQNRQKSAEQTE